MSIFTVAFCIELGGDVAAAGAEESGEQESLEEDFLASAEVVEDGQLAENRAKLEYINSVLSMIASIESAVPKVASASVLCVEPRSYYFELFS